MMNLFKIFEKTFIIKNSFNYGYHKYNTYHTYICLNKLVPSMPQISQ